MEDDDFIRPLHPLQLAMVDCIREQLGTLVAKDYILRSLNAAQLRDVIRFIESFDLDNLPE